MIHIVAQRISSWARTDSNISDRQQHRGKLHWAHISSLAIMLPSRIPYMLPGKICSHLSTTEEHSKLSPSQSPLIGDIMTEFLLFLLLCLMSSVVSTVFSLEHSRHVAAPQNSPNEKTKTFYGPFLYVSIYISENFKASLCNKEEFSISDSQVI